MKPAVQISSECIPEWNAKVLCPLNKGTKPVGQLAKIFFCDRGFATPSYYAKQPFADLLLVSRIGGENIDPLGQVQKIISRVQAYTDQFPAGGTDQADPCVRLLC